jgi:DNA polymerase-3 subunit delta'
LWLDFWRDLLLVRVGLGEAITNIDFEAKLTDFARDFSLVEIRAFINSLLSVGDELRQNANPRLALDVLMLNTPRRQEDRIRK